MRASERAAKTRARGAATSHSSTKRYSLPLAAAARARTVPATRAPARIALAAARWTATGGFAAWPLVAEVADELGRGGRARPAAAQQPPVARERGEALEERLRPPGGGDRDADRPVARAGGALDVGGARRDLERVAGLKHVGPPAGDELHRAVDRLEALGLADVDVRLDEEAARGGPLTSNCVRAPPVSAAVSRKRICAPSPRDAQHIARLRHPSSLRCGFAAPPLGANLLDCRACAGRDAAPDHPYSDRGT